MYDIAKPLMVRLAFCCVLVVFACCLAGGQASAQCGATYWYDGDGDGFGNPDGPTVECWTESYVSDNSDCNDSDSSVYPGATEYCDGKDNDCNGADDDFAVDSQTWYQDWDQDGYGDFWNSLQSCAPPSGYVSDSSDCDDYAPTVYPGAYEYCDGLDNDCNGTVDDTSFISTWYEDYDADGYGNPFVTIESCSQLDGYVDNASDCDDADNASYPGALEVCDDRDNDCNGLIDDGPFGSIWYRDLDFDGYGTPDDTVQACAQPDGYVSDSSDCNDFDQASTREPKRYATALTTTAIWRSTKAA